MTHGGPPVPERSGDGVSAAEPLLVQHVDARRFDGSRLRFAALAAVSLGMAALLIWSALPHPTSGSARRSATPASMTSNGWSVSIASISITSGAAIAPMPAFRDWHVAYVGPDETMRAVSIYGGQAVGGLPAPGLAAAAADLNEYPRLAALSPDSHYVAYSLTPASSPSTSTGSIMLLDVRAAALPQPYTGTESLHAQNLFWSPDSSKLAFESNRNGDFAIYYISPYKELPPQAVPGVSDGTSGIYQLLGWIDATHLAVLANQQGIAVLGALDMSTGELRVIARFTACCLGNVYLAPDGARAVVDSAENGTAIEVVDTTTGTTHMLPNVTHQLDSSWGTLAWEPGDHVLAVTASAIADESSGSVGLAIQLLDLDHDTLDTVAGDERALGWSPDGQVLVVGNPTNLAGSTAGELSEMTFRRPGVVDVLPLTQSAAAFVGFMRTA